MSIITPSDTALAYLAQLTIGQQRFDISEVSDTTGHSATRLGGPPRWTAALRTLDAMEPAISGLWKSIAVQLRGRVNHLALYDVSQPQPRGLARGALTLSSTAAAGAASIAIAGCVGSNRVLNGSFEVDSNADGLADRWTRYSSGTVGSLTHSLSGAVVWGGAFSQNLVAASMGGTSSDRQGVQGSLFNVPTLVGLPVIISTRLLGTSGSKGSLEVYWRDAGGTIIGSIISSALTLTGLEQVISATGTCPAGTVTADVYAYQHSGPGGAVGVYFDLVRVEPGSTIGAGADATLLDGDWLQIGSGVGSHFCMVTADATASDNGALTATIEPPLRKSFTSATVVTWDKPRAHFKQRPDSVSWSGVAGGTGAGGFALDLLEDWTA